MKKLKIWKWISLKFDKNFGLIIEYKGRKKKNINIEINNKKKKGIIKYLKNNQVNFNNIKNNKIKKENDNIIIWCNCIVWMDHNLTIGKNYLELNLLDKLKQDWILFWLNWVQNLIKNLSIKK